MESGHLVFSQRHALRELLDRPSGLIERAEVLAGLDDESLIGSGAIGRGCSEVLLSRRLIADRVGFCNLMHENPTRELEPLRLEHGLLELSPTQVLRELGDLRRILFRILDLRREAISLVAIALEWAGRQRPVAIAPRPDLRVQEFSETAVGVRDADFRLDALHRSLEGIDKAVAALDLRERVLIERAHLPEIAQADSGDVWAERYISAPGLHVGAQVVARHGIE